MHSIIHNSCRIIYYLIFISISEYYMLFYNTESIFYLCISKKYVLNFEINLTFNKNTHMH